MVLCRHLLHLQVCFWQSRLPKQLPSRVSRHKEKFPLQDKCKTCCWFFVLRLQTTWRHFKDCWKISDEVDIRFREETSPKFSAWLDTIICSQPLRKTRFKTFSQLMNGARCENEVFCKTAKISKSNWSRCALCLCHCHFSRIHCAIIKLPSKERKKFNFCFASLVSTSNERTNLFVLFYEA